ncbi:RNA-binding protein [Devosia sp.]|uniref:RNA-binding protein n=1 Tax=Devosia sp. TaxID=1871048 RepID=UPI003267E896
MARPEPTTRMCALTREEKPVAELIRFVVSPDGEIVPDTDAKAEGRGVWITLNRSSVEQAVKKKAFAKSLKTDVKVPDDLAGLTQLRLEQRFLSALAMCRKAGQLISGATKVRSALATGDLIALLTADDASADGRSKMVGPLKALHYAAEEEGNDGFEVPHFELLSSEQLGLALGLENVIHAALTKGAAARSAVEKARRLALFIATPGQNDSGRDAVDAEILSNATE